MHIVITGANRGIGAKLAQNFAARGDDVTGTARSDAALAQLDVTEAGSIKGFADKMGDRPIDLLVCNAGVYLDKGHTMQTGYAPELWANSFAANVTGVFLTIQNLLPNIEAAGGKIAIISSVMATSTQAPGGAYIYRASKAAVLNLGRNLAVDLKDRGVAVGIYHPGWVRTDMGGDGAAISVEESAAGLEARFDALNLASTGNFLSYDGTELAF